MSSAVWQIVVAIAFIVALPLAAVVNNPGGRRRLQEVLYRALISALAITGRGVRAAGRKAEKVRKDVTDRMGE